jgi:hypothetical protein
LNAPTTKASAGTAADTLIDFNITSRHKNVSGPVETGVYYYGI